MSEKLSIKLMKPILSFFSETDTKEDYVQNFLLSISEQENIFIGQEKYNRLQSAYFKIISIWGNTILSS